MRTENQPDMDVDERFFTVTTVFFFDNRRYLSLGYRRKDDTRFQIPFFEALLP